MTDIWSEEKRSEVMSKIRSKDTEPEVKIKEFLDELGVDYQFQEDVNGWDIDFLVGDRTIIEYRSCFWHLCDEHGKIPDSNRDYWGPKLRRNRKRDEEKDGELRKAGYEVEVIWSHDNLGERVEEIVHSSKLGVLEQVTRCVTKSPLSPS